MKKALRTLIVVIVVLTLALFAGWLWLRSSVYNEFIPALGQRIETLQISGYNVTYADIKVDWLRGWVEIEQVVLDKNPHDTTCLQPEFISAEKVRAEGVGLISLLLNKTLSLDVLTIENPHVHLRDGKLFSSAETSDQKPFTLGVDKLNISGARYTHIDSVGCMVAREVTGDITARGLALKFDPDEPFTYQTEAITITDAALHLPKAYYRIKLAHFSLTYPEGALQMDSIIVSPLLGNVEFGRAYGYEIDRFDAVIPSVKASGFKASFSDSAFVMADRVETQFILKVFRDKRLPFRAVQKDLPIVMMKNLPFGLRIDTLTVVRSYAEYQEKVPEATEPGKVYFDNLFATFHHIDNRSQTGNMEFSARSNLSGHGELNLNVRMPLETDKPSVARGSITGFPLPEINSMLTPSTQLVIEKGDMENLSFQFSFDKNQSAGELQLNYRDLKLVQLKDAPDGSTNDTTKDNLKTFIMNLFVFRKHMDERVPEEKRTGTIGFKRDANRSVFNYWVKSLVSGIKAAYNLPDQGSNVGKSPKEIRREERIARREARKARQAEKQRNRG